MDVFLYYFSDYTSCGDASACANRTIVRSKDEILCKTGSEETSEQGSEKTAT
jgi:hypothetical protein